MFLAQLLWGEFNFKAAFFSLVSPLFAWAPYLTLQLDLLACMCLCATLMHTHTQANYTNFFNKIFNKSIIQKIIALIFSLY